jgi:hypothetical protein
VQLGLDGSTVIGRAYQALISADGILPGSIANNQLLIINLALVPSGQLVNSLAVLSLTMYKRKRQIKL